MARTAKGTEFYLIDVRPASDDVDLKIVEHKLARSVRTGDRVFVWDGRVMAALVTDVAGVGLATRRLMRILKEQEEQPVRLGGDSPPPEPLI